MVFGVDSDTQLKTPQSLQRTQGRKSEAKGGRLESGGALHPMCIPVPSLDPEARRALVSTATHTGHGFSGDLWATSHHQQVVRTRGLDPPQPGLWFPQQRTWKKGDRWSHMLLTCGRGVGIKKAKKKRGHQSAKDTAPDVCGQRPGLRTHPKVGAWAETMGPQRPCGMSTPSRAAPQGGVHILLNLPCLSLVIPRGQLFDRQAGCHPHSTAAKLERGSLRAYGHPRPQRPMAPPCLQAHSCGTRLTDPGPSCHCNTVKANGHSPRPTPEQGSQLHTLPGPPPHFTGQGVAGVLGLSEAPGNSHATGLRTTAWEEVPTAPPGAHPVLLLRPQLPHALQQPGLGPVQIGSEACDGDDVRLQLRCWDVYVHLVDTEQTRCT